MSFAITSAGQHSCLKEAKERQVVWEPVNKEAGGLMLFPMMYVFSREHLWLAVIQYFDHTELIL